RIGWYYMNDPMKGNTNYLSLTRQFYNNSMVMTGVLVITVNGQTLQSILSQEPFETMLVTDRGDIVAATDPALVGRSGIELDIGYSHGRESVESDSTMYEEEPVKMISHAIKLENSDNHLRIVSIVPLKTILKDSRRVSNIAYGMIGVSLVLSTMLILYFSRMLTKRLHLLSREIRKVGMGDFSLRSAMQGSDEVGQLARHFNFMVSNIEHLVNQVNEEQRQKHQLLLNHNQMKFRMLANQVNPHFLFNVLETVRMKAHCQNEHEIANTLAALGSLLRQSLEIGQKPIPLARELELVGMYLSIQRLRFGDKLTYSLPRHEDAEGIVVLPMLLQPVVENAIVHGIESKLGEGTI